METLVLGNKYKIVVPLFGAAYAAPNIGTTILYWFRPLSTVLSPTENSRIQGLLSDFPVLFKADFIFKDFARQPSKFKYFSSLCEPFSAGWFAVCDCVISWSLLLVTKCFVANFMYYKTSSPKG